MADGLSPFHYSKFRRVWIGQLANITGDGAYPVAIALFLLPRHQAARTLGIVLAATSVGAIVSLLFAGVLADRHRRSFVMIGSDAARAAGIVGIIVVGANGALPDLAVYGFILGVGVGESRPVSGPAENSILKDMGLGFKYVIGRPWMAAVMIQGTIYVAFVTSPVTVLLPIFLGVEHKVWFGFIVAADAAGAFLGISIGSAVKSQTPGRIAMLAALLPIPQLLCVGLDLPLWLLLASSMLAGVGLAMFGIIWTTSLQTKVSPDVLGRVFAFDAFSSTCLAPVGFAVAGWAISHAGTSDVALGAVVILVVSVLVPLLCVPGVARFADGHPDDIPVTVSRLPPPERRRTAPRSPRP